MKRIAGYLLFAAVLVSGCGARPDRVQERQPIPVRVLAVGQTSEILSRSYVGTVIPEKKASLSCRHSGTLVKLAVSRGDVVSKGDVIAVIESQTVLSMVESTSAMLAQAEDGYERVSKVHGSGGVADVQMVEIETKLRQARAAARAAEKALEDCTVRAPFDGVIGEVYADEGVELSAVEPVVRLFDISSVKLDFSVPEKEIGRIAVGGRASVEVPALVSGEDSVRGRFTARIISKGVSASPLSHAYSCILAPESGVPGLMPGMVCKVFMDMDLRSGVVIPASVVRIDGNGRYVWIAGDDDVVSKRYIVTEGFAGKGTVVSSGLEDGDRIITEGVQKVCTGMKIRVIE